ncbi:glycosyltransferase 87 family protein [Formosa haliotis]|uniref:glycosyltransferase 87 family protein n=1 Tax=Formosa haliotis TaxID=1555194 RepID=UPI00082579B2|nr:glycosyltransferase 87 family protein [Formosa haliotis]
MSLKFPLNKTLTFQLLIVFVTGIFYSSFAYNLVRTDYAKLIILYFALFFLSVKLIQFNRNNTKALWRYSILFRVIFIVSIPNLSQDFYRFIWDGRMLFEGFNPFLHTPDSFILNDEFPIAQAQDLYQGMGALSASHFTNYPPVSQLCYFLAALFAKQSILGAVVVMRLLIICADIVTLYFGSKLLKHLKLPTYYIFWYILNPFIIIELTGNLHFEGVMICFLVISLYLLQKLKWQWAAVTFSLAVATKLIPLIFLPLILKYLRLKKGLLFCAIVGIINIALFLPFMSMEFISNYTETVGLWFKNFEFNASIFNIVKGIGYAFTGYNKIKLLGPIMAVLVIIYITILTYKAPLKHIKNLMVNMLLVITIYYFMSTTVHPWYISLLVILAVFTNYKFPLIWSLVVIFSYLAYANADNTENLWVIGLEYVFVYSAFIYEVVLKKQINFWGVSSSGIQPNN